MSKPRITVKTAVHLSLLLEPEFAWSHTAINGISTVDCPAGNHIYCFEQTLFSMGELPR